MSQTNEDNQTDKLAVPNPERDQIIKMFCNDIKEINSQNEVRRNILNHSVDGLPYIER